MATLPTTPPSVTAWPTSPSRARPATFATEADAFLGHFPVGQADQQNLVNWLNSTAGQSYTNALEAAASATNSAASAQLAQDALDSAISATNYKGAWSSLSGALNIPASVSHNNGLWLLTANLANVAASEPSEANSNWFLVFRKATDLDVENGTQYANPDAKQLKGFVQRNWSSLTTAKTYGDSCFYNGKEYVIRNPVDDPTIAPPSTAGRSYFEFDGVSSYLNMALLVEAGDIVRMRVKPNNITVADSRLLENNPGDNQLILNISKSQTTLQLILLGGSNLTINGKSTDLIDESLVSDIEFTSLVNTAIKFVSVGADNTSLKYKGRIYDLEVIRSGTRIHYFPLRTDAVDYLAGNLVKDEEFTWEGNWNPTTRVKVQNNSAEFINGDASTFVIQSNPNITQVGTYRFKYDYSITSGSIKLTTPNLADFDVYQTGQGTRDYIGVVDSVVDGRVGFLSTEGTNGQIKNVKVIQLNELSPSASFTSAAGFTVSSVGVTFNAGYASFDGVTNTKQLTFDPEYRKSVKAGQKFRFAYKTYGATQGNIRAQSLDGNVMTLETFNSGNVLTDITLTVLQDHVLTPFLYTVDGWNGNVEYFSVTEVTDGTENGSPVKTFDKHWQLTSGEQFLPSSAGLVKFGDNLAIDSNNTLEIEPLANGSRGDTIKLARKEGFTPIIKLSATDVSAGKLIRYGVLTDTQLTLDTDKIATLIHNGTDIEVKI